MPEFKETIENNFFFRNEIIDILEDVGVELYYNKDDIITEIVGAISTHIVDIQIGSEKLGEVVKDKQEMVIAIYEVFKEASFAVEVVNKKEIAEEILEKLTQFVKENYGLSIKEAYLQSLSII